MTSPAVYQGEFGDFTITKDDRTGVIIYRSGLAVSAIAFAVGCFLVLFYGATPPIINTLTWLFAIFSVGLGVSLFTIHIYMEVLHRALQLFWLIGTLAAGAIALTANQPLALYIYNHPLTLFGLGFSFAALTGIFFKEAFCFNRFETKILTLIVPSLLLGHMMGILSAGLEQVLLGIWGVLYLVFALRKAIQAIPPDIGDKSVFEYLKQQKA